MLQLSENPNYSLNALKAEMAAKWESLCNDSSWLKTALAARAYLPFYRQRDENQTEDTPDTYTHVCSSALSVHAYCMHVKR